MHAHKMKNLIKQGNSRIKIRKSQKIEKQVDLRLKKERTLEKWRGKKKKGEEENCEGLHGDNGESNGERRLRVETPIREKETTKLRFSRVKVGDP